MKHFLLFEINTHCWLHERFPASLGREITLADVPDAEFTRWQKLGFTHIWLMGVWTQDKIPFHRTRKPGAQNIYHRVLPGWTSDDVPARLMPLPTITSRQLWAATPT